MINEESRFIAGWYRYWLTVIINETGPCSKIRAFEGWFGHLGIDFIFYDNQLDRSSPSGKLVFNIFGAVAEFVREIIRERVRSDLANARRNGKRYGTDTPV